MTGLPSAPPAFAAKKARILAQLAVPDAEYTDASPKGSIDVGIRELIDEINAVEGLVTTSSCAGRVCVFLEGQRFQSTGAEESLESVAGVGGKGGGGRWLYVSHEPVVEGNGEREFWSCLASDEADKGFGVGEVGDLSPRLIHFKFEPMILHILTASAEHAQLLLRCGLQAGFRESGAINLTGSARDPVTPMVAIRSAGLMFETLLGVQEGTRRASFVSAELKHHLIVIANERFAENTKRIRRFEEALRAAVGATGATSTGGDWEDAAARRERKRAEGLRRQQDLRAKDATAKSTENGVEEIMLSIDEIQHPTGQG